MPSAPVIATADQDLVVLHRTPGRCAFGHHGNVALQAWHEPPDAADARALHTASVQLVQRYPMGLSSIHWVRSGGRLPDHEARSVMSRTLAAYGDHYGRLAIVLNGDGFWAGAVRGMLTGLGIASGNREAFRVVASTVEAVRWLSEPHRQRTGVTVDGPRLCQSVARLVESI